MITSLATLDQFSRDEIFAPVPVNEIGNLLIEYQDKKKRILEISKIMNHNYNDLIQFFMEPGSMYLAEKMFTAEKAVKALNSHCWQKALLLTDIYDIMPQKRRDEWNLQIEKHTTPDFEADTVIKTLESLLEMRAQFLSEKVDGIFQALSSNHLTNQPEGFSKRLIIERLLTFYGVLSSVDYRRCGYVHDLRCVIAKLMGRDEPDYYLTSSLIEDLYREGRTGEWVDVDGGAFRLKVYKKGTVHLEIHPDLAWRLNVILAHLHPFIIPSELRKRPSYTKKKEVALINNLLPFKVIKVLKDMNKKKNTNTYYFSVFNLDKHLLEKVVQTLSSLGGVVKNNSVSFDYDVSEVLKEVLSSGMLPDQKSYQYYPTPSEIAKEAVEWAEIEEEHSCLEPSAGQGGLAEFMPENTTCVEVSSLHCEILRSKGFNTTEEDFLEWAKAAPTFDRIVMNPPFSEGRWKAHVEAAASLLASGGVLVAILPSSARTLTLEGLSVEFSPLIDGNSFGVSISLVMMKGRKV